MIGPFWKAALTMVAAIIGAGIFALPKAFSQFGFWPSTVIFWSIAVIVALTHFMFVEVELSLARRGRLASAVREWLGEEAYRLASVSYPFQLGGALIAYILLGAGFLQTLLGSFVIDIPSFGWKLLFWLGGAITVFAGLRWVARVESVLVWILLTTLLILSLLQLQQGSELLPVAHWGGSLRLFGICLFSLSGISGVGEVVDIVGRQRRLARLAVLVGTLLAAGVSWLFAVSFANAALPDGRLTMVLALAGFLAVSGAFIIASQDVRATLRLDLRLPPKWSLGLSLSLPLLLALILRPNVYGVIDAVGTIFGGLNGLFIALVASRIYAHRHDSYKNWREIVCILIGLIYLGGIAHWAWRFVL